MEADFLQDWTQIRNFKAGPLPEEKRQALVRATAGLLPAGTDKLRILHLDSAQPLNDLRKEAINDGRWVPYGLLTLAKAVQSSEGLMVPWDWQAEQALRQVLFDEIERLGLAAYQRAVYPSRWYLDLVRKSLALEADWLPMHFIFIGIAEGFAFGHQTFEINQKRETRGENWID